MDFLFDAKLQRMCFRGSVFTLPFTVIPITLPLVNNKLPDFFLFIGIFLFILKCLVKNVKFNKNEKIFLIFLIGSFLWVTISAILGVIFYPYYSVINLLQMENFKNFYDNLVSFSIYIDDLTAIKAWLLYKAIRYSFFYVLFSFAGVFWIYHLYKDNWQEGIHDLKNASISICIVLIIYSTIEIGYLCGIDFCKEILEKINPLYMDIKSAHGWWPPLVWPQLQLRSMFPEPSFLGIFLMMVIPFFAFAFYSEKILRKNIFLILTYVCLIMMLVMSKARTGLLLFIGEFILIISWSFAYHFYQWKKTLLLFACTVLAFFIGLGLTSQFQVVNSCMTNAMRSVSVENYVNDNIKSAMGNSRSNNARRANVLATIRTGLDNPMFGVGLTMRNEEVAAHLTDEEKHAREVTLWITYMNEKGPLKSGFPILNHFSVVLAEQGIIGMILFIIPYGYIYFLIVKRRNILHDNRIACLCISFTGLFTALFSNSAKMELFIVMGLLLSVLLNYNKVGKNNE